MFAWQATPQEKNRVLTGDELVPDATDQNTYAVSIDAPPAAVWPWLVQMGCDRAGWYSYDRLDNGGRPSADSILPEFQQVREGHVWPSRPGSEDGFAVVRLDPPSTLLLGAHLTVPGFKPLAWNAPRRKRYVRSLWGFHLEGDNGGTRLLVRTRTLTTPWAARVAVKLLFGGVVHWFMQRRQLLNLKARAEAQAERP